MALGIGVELVAELMTGVAVVAMITLPGAVATAELVLLITMLESIGLLLEVRLKVDIGVLEGPIEVEVRMVIADAVGLILLVDGLGVAKVLLSM